MNHCSDHLLSAVSAIRAISAQDDAQLEAAVERHGDALERRIGLAGGRVGAERIRVGEDVVGDDERRPARASSRASREQLLVVVLLRVEEDDVEDVVDRGRASRTRRPRRARPTPRAPPRRCSAATPRSSPGRPRARGRGRRAVARRRRARSSSSRASRRSRAPRSRPAARRGRRGTRRSSARPGASAYLLRQAALTLVGVLRLEPREHGADAIVEHQPRFDLRSTAPRPSSRRGGR